MTASHWAAVTVAEASIDHQHSGSGAAETWSGVALGSYTFMPGVHEISGQLYSVDRYGKLALNKNVGAYWADANGVLTQTASSYQQSYVPYISQIDNIYAWVGCEPVSALMGLKPTAMHRMSTSQPSLIACRFPPPILSGDLSARRMLLTIPCAQQSIPPPR